MQFRFVRQYVEDRNSSLTKLDEMYKLIEDKLEGWNRTDSYTNLKRFVMTISQDKETYTILSLLTLDNGPFWDG